MAWVPRTVDSDRRPTRPNYVPPPFRAHNSGSDSFAFSDESARHQLGRNGASYGRGRGRGGRRGRGWNHLRGPFNQNQNREDPFNDLSEKFDELEVSGEGITNGSSDTAINFDAYEDIPVEASGSDVPPAVDTFADIDLGDALNRNIKRCKYVRPTPIQRHAIPIAVAGRDLMACAQTGSGKTAAFCFPIISGILKNQGMVLGRWNQVAYPTALILSPTRELASQIQDEAKKFAYETSIKIAVVYGGAPIMQQFRNLDKGVDILVAAPGRLIDMVERGKVSFKMVKYLVLDEADRMLDMGFEPQIRKIVQQMGMPPPGSRQTLLFSATFPEEIQRLASDFLSNYIFLTVGRVGSSTNLIAQKVELVEDPDKRAHLIKLLQTERENGSNGKALTLVFVETKKGADSLEHWLLKNGLPAIAIHGDKIQMEREHALRSFKSGATPILVATDVASRGLDIPHVAHVINFDLPQDIDGYVHRIGRTGRAGKSGVATAFFAEKNMALAKALAELMKESNQEVPAWLTEYAASPFYGGGSSRSNRSGRYGGSSFGGYDFRTENQYDSYTYTEPESFSTFGHESVVATGWE
ncbi:DEAD-box ATP-dependent RNA helicase 52-like isoform X2 [Tripterygium wilfordii]|uniref:DEAD-box ATP-dependent RNA helicase 52-like isoform X2 n=1 Tax=Tripterygium wilfordii TaxID=458696 RepID=UPI0018F7F214|nr:DEAD-box ATP-dependent RNA helicase 52-like isoform X2 [Tripterygium wilfordii]